jgi:hypothetical protein
LGKALAMGCRAALKDTYHRPKPPGIGDDAKAWVVHMACSKPKDLGYAAEAWSSQSLAKHIREHAPFDARQEFPIGVLLNLPILRT